MMSEKEMKQTKTHQHFHCNIIPLYDSENYLLLNLWLCLLCSNVFDEKTIQKLLGPTISKEDRLKAVCPTCKKPVYVEYLIELPEKCQEVSSDE